MNKVIQKSQWMCAGLLATLLSASSVWADDTEILLINPNAANPPDPNVLFILDTSGSMGNQVRTKVIYDSARSYSTGYPNSCDPNMLYWTDVNAVPSCDAANTKKIAKSAFKCDNATARLNGIGSYTNTFVQFRSIGWFGQGKWQTLEPNNTSGMVECQRDRGEHGDGVSNNYYVSKNTSLLGTPLFTSQTDQEVDWSSDSVSNAVTFYDGNYLNYRAAPEYNWQRKLDIVKDVTNVVMDSIENVNVGVMRFNNNEGGPVIQAITDLNTNRTTINNAINSLTATGATPLSETLYESALYWRGMPAYYGERRNEYPTHPDALASDDPEVYQAPEFQTCAKNFNVLLTDGEPNQDFGTPGLVDGLPNWQPALGHTGCTGTGQGDCLDDVAEYLFKEDIDPVEPGLQRVTTHTIGFAINLPVMQQAAALSGGEYFLADDVESLTLALLKIVANIQQQSLAFTSPAVAVNSFNRTQNLNDLYLTTFGARGKVHWPGNLKKYRITDGKIVDSNGTDAIDVATGYFVNNAQSFWSVGTDGRDVELGGAAHQIPPPATRRLFTYNGTDTNLASGVNHISVSNETAYTLADFGLTGSATEPTRAQIIDWARGLDLRDEDKDGSTTDTRNVMGDPLHSKPAAVVYGGDAANPEVVVYAATNDGYVHAIDGANGRELWSFVPKEHMSNFSKLYFNPDATYKTYGVDGDITPIVKDVDNDGIIETTDGDFVYIIFGMRRGGDSYYALDVTDKYNPRFMWRFQTAGINQSWSAPTVARVSMTTAQNADNAVVIFGGGYDTGHDTLAHPTTPDSVGNGIYMLDLASGAVLWRAGSDDPAHLTLNATGRAMNRAIPSAIRVIDLNGDGLADRMYASDMGGQIWRFDIFNGKDPNDENGPNQLVTGGVIAQLGAEGNLPATYADTRRFYGSPDISIFNDNAQNRRFLSISIGSGYRAHPLDDRTTERFYSIRDPYVFGSMTQAQYNSYSIIRDGDLVEVSGTVGTTIGPLDAGWKFTLPPDQKVLTDSSTFNNEVFFVAFSADNAAAAACAESVGRNYLYRVSVKNGDPIGDLDNVVAGTEDQLRVSELAQGGIAPTPRFLFPSPDDPNCTGDDCAPPPIGCIGVECFDPGFENSPVRTLWTQDGIE